MKINSYILTLATLFLFVCKSSAQVPSKRTDECNCTITFNDMVNKLENNYIGLKQMQISHNIADYEKRKNKYGQKSTDIFPENCTEFLNDFLSYFEDGHLSVFERPNHLESDLIENRKRIKSAKLSKDSLKQRLYSIKETSNNEEKALIAGHWTDGESIFVILKVEEDYHAYIFETTMEGVEAGELKAIYRTKDKGYSSTYYSYKYGASFLQVDVFKDGTLLVAGHIIWKKVEPSFSLVSNKIDDLKLPTIEIIDETSILVTIPSFIVNYQVFNDFVQDNKKLINNSTNLIVDIRGNRGGNGVYFPLIEIYATQNMDGSQGLVLASSDNLAYFKRQMKYSSKIYKPVVSRIEGNFGQIVDGPLYPGKKFKNKKSKLRNVAILIDNACASAAESFIIHSKGASSKVKTFGNATAGMIDYTSVNSLLLESGKQYIYFGYPTSTLHKEIPSNGYNKTGILPDVPINKRQKDKIDFIISNYE